MKGRLLTASGNNLKNQDKIFPVSPGSMQNIMFDIRGNVDDLLFRKRFYMIMYIDLQIPFCYIIDFEHWMIVHEFDNRI